MRHFIAGLLEDEGYDVVALEDGRALLKYLNPLINGVEGIRPPDLLISDIQMPGATGLEALSALRRAGVLVPAILLTAFGDAATHAAAQRLSASVLDKPFDPDTLIERVRNLLSRA